MAETKKGRPTKPGLDYSQIDCDFSRKGLALQVRKKYGLEGLAVLYEVLVWINEGKGCYVECESAADAAEQFATTRLFDINKCEWVEEVFMFMLKIGFFDRDALLRDKILTSEGITRRWYEAKRSGWESKKRECPYDLPESIQNYIATFFTPKYEKNAENETFPTPKCAETAENTPKTPQKCYRVKESKVKESTFLKERKKEEEVCEVIAETKRSERWSEIRERIAALIYEPGLSADLTDAITAAAVKMWITVPQLHSWLRKARDELEVNRRTDQQRGKKERWKTLRPWIEEVYSVHGLPLPKCDGRNKEPPPIHPKDDTPESLEKARYEAGRAIMPR